jgi:outer membrane protein TolC
MLIAPASPQDGLIQSTKKIQDLQKKRIAVLKEAADQTAELFKLGQVSPEAALDAMLLVLEAELDAAEKESDRVTLYKKIVDVHKKHEEVVDAGVQVGRETHVSLLKARARRLKAEIDLERAKAKGPK